RTCSRNARPRRRAAGTCWSSCRFSWQAGQQEFGARIPGLDEERGAARHLEIERRRAGAPGGIEHDAHPVRPAGEAHADRAVRCQRAANRHLAGGKPGGVEARAEDEVVALLADEEIAQEEEPFGRGPDMLAVTHAAPA